MKKLLLGALLLLSSFVCMAQETFVKKYTSMIAVSNNVKGEWQSTDMTVVFNPKGVTDIVFYYPNGSIRTFHQITDMTKDTTTNGDEYQIVECLDESGDRVAIQLFDDDTCLRVIIDKGWFIEFHKD
jgi:hypothetical protein